MKIAPSTNLYSTPVSTAKEAAPATKAVQSASQPIAFGNKIGIAKTAFKVISFAGAIKLIANVLKSAINFIKSTGGSLKKFVNAETLKNIFDKTEGVFAKGKSLITSLKSVFAKPNVQA